MIVATQTTPNPYLPGSQDSVYFIYWRQGPVTASVLVVGLKATCVSPTLWRLHESSRAASRRHFADDVRGSISVAGAIVPERLARSGPSSLSMPIDKWNWLTVQP